MWIAFVRRGRLDARPRARFPLSEATAGGAEALCLRGVARLGLCVIAFAVATALAANDAAAQTPAVRIHAIQGAGATVVRTDRVAVDAIVIGDFQGAEQLQGFFLEEEDVDQDLDPATSEGIFIDCGACPVDVAVGDRVVVHGHPLEHEGMSRMRAVDAGDVGIVERGKPLPTAALLVLGVPFDSAASHERLEGMLVAHRGPLHVAEAFELDRFGQLVLSETRSFQYTQRMPPSVAGFAAHRDAVRRARIVLDDDDDLQDAPLV